MNTGQFKTVLRDQYLIDATPLNKVSGQPFAIAEIEAAIATFFDAIPGNEGGEVAPNATQLPTPESGHDDGSLHPERHSPQSARAER
jgi:2-oxoglutarate ferredoxin oxidoreductase subunit alpha